MGIVIWLLLFLFLLCRVVVGIGFGVEEGFFVFVWDGVFVLFLV